MIIDAHTHLFFQDVVDNRTPFFDNEPEFMLLYDSPKSKIATASQLIETMDQHGVDVSIIFGFPWRNPEYAQRNNDAIIAAVNTHPKRLRGLACFDLSWEGAAKEAERCIDAGLSGVGELAFYMSGIDDRAIRLLEPVMEVLKHKGNLPCMIHTNEPVGHHYPGKSPVTLGQIDNLAQTFSDNKIILAHWGGGIFFYHTMKKQMKERLKNIWYDTAASVFLYDPKIYDMAVTAGVLKKVLLGTDYPLLTPDRYYKDLDQSQLTLEQKRMVLGENARALFPDIQ
ncbi:amidohydrolase family protein [uncultured Desulfobacter sp.]|uniref:amidohydrolase family protein n=1 Tax=uncultured Desulfobacter sp. TaxID=240139 RepID=UPI0029F5C352|nr:amidohydrolase family protein [uncultured Desulfobacter sp.]